MTFSRPFVMDIYIYIHLSRYTRMAPPQRHKSNILPKWFQLIFSESLRGYDMVWYTPICIYIIYIYIIYIIYIILYYILYIYIIYYIYYMLYIYYILYIYILWIYYINIYIIIIILLLLLYNNNIHTSYVYSEIPTLCWASVPLWSAPRRLCVTRWPSAPCARTKPLLGRSCIDGP